MKFDVAHIRLCLVTAEDLYESEEHLQLKVSDAVKGGISMVQLREKKSGIRTFLSRARLLKSLLSPYGIPLMINDRVDVALAVGADGVHLGQSDMPIHYARKLLGPDRIIGLSIEDEKQAIVSNGLPIDYIGLSPVFYTSTKRDIASPLGLEGVKRVTKVCDHPAIAIGGINLDNVANVIRSGAEGAAVVSYLMKAKQVTIAAAMMKEAIHLAL